MIDLLKYDHSNVIHVTPVDDLREHDDCKECWCNPKVEVQDNGGLVVVHNSMDMREYAEPDHQKVQS